MSNAKKPTSYFKSVAARIISEAKAKAVAKAAADLKRIKDEAALYPAKERRAYLDRKRAQMQNYHAWERRPITDLHYTDEIELLSLLALQLKHYDNERSQITPDYMVIVISRLESARIISNALADILTESED